MWSRETFPAAWNCIVGLRLIQELVDPYPFLGGQVLREYPAEQLAGPRDAADDSGLLTVGEDRRVPVPRTTDRAHPVQGVAALEQLQIARAQREPVNAVPGPAVENGGDVVEILRGGGTDVGAVLEHAALVGRLGQHAHRELVRVEMPRV